MKNERLALVGFMASGKSTVGQVLAARLNWPFIDLDTYIESWAGQTIQSLFAVSGEDCFRSYERQGLCRIDEEMDNVVLATGGGIVTQETCRSLLDERFFCIYLRATPDTILDRLASAETIRPLLDGVNPGLRVESLLHSRSQWYNDIADMTVDVDDMSVDDVVDEIVRRKGN